MTHSAIYYTDNGLDPEMLRVCQEQLKQAYSGEIVSCSLKPMDFGRNIVVEGVRSYPTYIKQILTALEAATTDVVFFCEHDVIYSPSHFKLLPEKPEVYYYNVNNYRWRWGTDVAVTYDELSSLSGMVCYRETAIKHYKLRMKICVEHELDEQRSREPRWARRFGYEPGTKPIRRGGITNETSVKWKSEYPNIDIRHKGTFSNPKTFAREFNHLPETFREVNVFDIPGWDLPKLFNFKKEGVQYERKT